MSNKPQRSTKEKSILKISEIAKDLQTSDNNFFKAFTKRKLSFSNSKSGNSPLSVSGQANSSKNSIAALDLSNITIRTDSIGAELFQSPKTSLFKEIEKNRSLESLNFFPFATKMVFDKKPIKKLIIQQIPTFSGLKSDLQRFLSLCEEVFSSIPDENAAEIPSLITFLINQKMPDTLHERLSGKHLNTFDEFKDALRNAILISVNLHSVQKLLDEVVQKDSEPVLDYSNRIKSFDLDLRIAYKNNNVESNQVSNLVQSTLYNYFMKNLKPQLNQLVLSKSLKTIDTCVDELSKIEQLVSNNSAEKKLEDLIRKIQIDASKPAKNAEDPGNSRRRFSSYNEMRNTQGNFNRNVNFNRQNGFNNRNNFNGSNNFRRNNSNFNNRFSNGFQNRSFNNMRNFSQPSFQRSQGALMAPHNNFSPRNIFPNNNNFNQNRNGFSGNFNNNFRNNSQQLPRPSTSNNGQANQAQTQNFSQPPNTNNSQQKN
jgi:hypothetical protein